MRWTDEFSMRIWLNPDKMASLGLSASEVLSAIQEQNVQVAAGLNRNIPTTYRSAF